MVNNYDVIVITHLFHPHVGGIETSAKNLLEFLDREKQQKCAIYYCSNETKSWNLGNVDCFSQKTIIILNSLYPLASIRFGISLLRALRRNKNAKIVIFGRHLTPTLIASFLCKILGRNYVYVDTGFQPNIFQSVLLNRVVDLADKFIFVNVVRWATCRIIISEYTLGIFKKQFPKINDKIEIINNGFSEEIIGQYTPVKKSKNVVWAARISEIKDPRTVISAYSMLAPKYPDWNFYLIGKGDFEIDAEKYKSNQNIIINQNLLPQNELLSLLNQSSLYINSSISEGMSVGVLEASALGCVPILSDADSNVEIAKKLGIESNLFKRKHVDDLVEKISRNIDEFNEDLSRDISEKAYKNFGSGVIFERYWELIENVSS